MPQDDVVDAVRLRIMHDLLGRVADRNREARLDTLFRRSALQRAELLLIVLARALDRSLRLDVLRRLGRACNRKDVHAGAEFSG